MKKKTNVQQPRFFNFWFIFVAFWVGTMIIAFKIGDKMDTDLWFISILIIGFAYMIAVKFWRDGK